MLEKSSVEADIDFRRFLMRLVCDMTCVISSFRSRTLSRHCHISLGIRSYCLRIFSLQYHHLSHSRAQSGKSHQLSPTLLITPLCVMRTRRKKWEQERTLGTNTLGCSFLLVQCCYYIAKQENLLELPFRFVYGSCVARVPESSQFTSAGLTLGLDVDA